MSNTIRMTRSKRAGRLGGERCREACRRDGDRDRAEERRPERDLRAVEDAAQEIAAEMVGAERMGRLGEAKAVRDVERARRDRAR